MKILLLVAFVALANADVSHLQHPGYAYQKPAETYGTPLSSYGVPQGSVQGLPSFEGFGSAKSFDQYNQDYLKAFANSPASSQLSFSNIQQPGSFQAPVSAQFGLPSAQQGVSFQSAGFSNPSPSVDVSNFQFSTPAPSVDVSNFQFSTPAPSADLSAFQFSTPAPAVASAGVSGVSVADGQFSTPKPSVNVLQYSQPQSFGFGSGFNSASFPGASASGFAGFGQSVVGKTSGGSIDDAFGASNDAQVGNEEQKTQVSKHLYFFAAPEEPEEEVKPRINLPAQAAQKSYKIIFIKAPTYKSQLPINIPAPPANEEKTLVYVLVKKPDAQATINVQPSQPAKPTKPEVFFIKYKSQKEAEEAVAKLQSQYGVSVSPNFESANALDSASVPAGVGSQAESGFSGFGLEGRNAIISSQPELPSGSFGSLSQSEGQGFVGFGGNSVSAPEIKSFGGVVSNQPEVVGFGGFGSSTPTPVTFGGNSADSLRVFGAGVGGLGQVGLSGGNANLLQAKFGFNVGSTESPAGAGVSVESSSPAAVVSSPAEESAPEEEASTEASSTDDASQNAVDNSEVAVSTLARSGDSGVNYQSEGSNFYQTGFQTYGVPKCGWYVLRDWNDQDFDGMSVLAKLQVHYGTSPYFKIHVEPNPLDPGASSIRISPSGLGLPDRDYYYRDTDDRIQAAYKEYIRDVIIYLSSTTNEASKFGQDMYSYERRIAEITPSLVTLQNPVVTYNAISISELKATNLIPFYDILQAMYPNANISENTEVLVTSLEYLNQVAQIIASTDRRTMNGYLIWTLVRKYAPYLSESYTSAVDIFHSKLLGVSKARKRWEICSQLVRDHMGLATEYYFEKNRPISAETYDVVNDTFNVILDVVKERIRQFDGTDLLYQQLKSKLDTLHLQIGLPDSARAALFLKDYYAPLKIIKGYLFESVKNSVEFQKKVEQKMLLKQLLESTVLEPLFREVPQVTYSAPNNLIIVPRSLVSDPYFEAGFPKPVVYGRLGVELAESVVSSVLPYGSSWTSEKKILSPFHMTVNESFKAALPAVNCLAEFVSDLNLDVSVDRANETGLTLLKKLSAVSVAYEALLKKTQTLSHIHQPGLEEFEDAALFFLSYGQSQCSNSTSQHQLYDNMIHFNLPQNSVLHLAWAQLPYFPESFQCLPNKKLRCPGIF